MTHSLKSFFLLLLLLFLYPKYDSQKNKNTNMETIVAKCFLEWSILRWLLSIPMNFIGCKWTLSIGWLFCSCIFKKKGKKKRKKKDIWKLFPEFKRVYLHTKFEVLLDLLLDQSLLQHCRHIVLSYICHV